MFNAVLVKSYVCMTIKLTKLVVGIINGIKSVDIEKMFKNNEL